MANDEKWKLSVLQFLDNMRLLFLMLLDWWRGTYRQLPWWCYSGPGKKDNNGQSIRCDPN